MSGARADGGMKAAAWPHVMPKTARVRSGDDDRNMLKTICSSATSRLALGCFAPL